MWGQMSADAREEVRDAGQSPASWLHSAWRWLRMLLGVTALVLAGLGAYARRDQLGDAAQLFTRINFVWLGLAIACQTASMIVFARLQRWLLRAGGVRVGLGDMVEITLAANALGTSLPGGAAWSATWAFSQLRRRGVDRVLAVWVLLVAGALASFALFILITVGSWMAGPTGPVSDLRPVTTALAAIPVTAGIMWYGAHRSPAVRTALSRSWRTIQRAVPGTAWLGRVTAGLMRRLATVQPGPIGWLETFGMALANWLYDGLGLTFCLLALHLKVPWPDMVLIYALTKTAASLPITPGGLGVVEGSLALLLIAYGVPATGALAGVLLYRIVSFWVLVPIGWVIWFVLEIAIRGGLRARPHPWAVHTHGSQLGHDSTRAPDLVLRPTRCEGCDQRMAAATASPASDRR